MRFAILSLAFILVTLSFFPLLDPLEFSGDGYSVAAESQEESNSTLVYPFDEHFLDYPGYENLTDQLFAIQANHSDIMEIYDLTELTSFGATHYDRVVWGVKISDGVDDEPDWYNDPDEEDIVIVGAHHAREWMTISACLYFIYYLTEFYGSEGIDNDGDGKVDEDRLDGYDNDWDGEDDDGDEATMPRMDGNDNDEDGLIDEGIDEDLMEGLVTYLVDNREIWIVPLLNPDGYEYDRTISEPGQGGGWRKNQRDQSQNLGMRSDGNGYFDEENDGVDLNRNYPYEWNRNEKGYVLATDGITVTSDSRTESDAQYRGPDDDIDDDDDGWGIDPVTGNRIIDPDGTDEDYWNGRDDDGDGLIDEDKDGGCTEPETQAMEELMKKLDIYDENDTATYPDGYRPENYDGISNAVIGISYHSYSALLIWPWGYTYEDPEDEGLLSTIGEKMMDITDYGSWKAQGGYKVSGEWGDWMYGSHGVLAYTIELNRGNQGGFHPLQKYIIPTVRMNLGCNVYISEIAHKAKIAKETGADDLEVDFPELVHHQKWWWIESDENYGVEVTVLNSSNLDPGSVSIWYRTGTGTGDWIQVPMTEKGTGGDVFKAEIPGQEEDTRVDYYFEARDSRGIIIHSGYGIGSPFSYTVEEARFLPLPWIDAMIMVFLVALLIQRKKSCRDDPNRGWKGPSQDENAGDWKRSAIEGKTGEWKRSAIEGKTGEWKRSAIERKTGEWKVSPLNAGERENGNDQPLMILQERER